MTAIPMFEIEFTKEGRLFDTRQTDAVVDALPQFSDLIVFSHGWNNDMADARALSHDFLQKVEEVFDEGIVPEVQGRTFSAIIVLWPSKKFTDEELIPGGGASLNEDLRPVERILEELKNDPNRLGQQDVSEVRKKLVDQAKALLPQLKVDAAARRDYVFLLRALVSPTEAHADDGSLEFFTRKPEEIFNAMSAAVAAPIGPGAGGTTSLGGGGAAGLKDIVDGIVGAARRLANFATYYQMKERAGLVGRTGLNQVLRRLRKQKPALRLHPDRAQLRRAAGHGGGGRAGRQYRRSDVGAGARRLLAQRPGAEVRWPERWIFSQAHHREARLGTDHHHAHEKRLAVGIVAYIEHDGCRVRRRERSVRGARAQRRAAHAGSQGVGAGLGGPHR